MTLHLPPAAFAIFCALNDPWQIEELYSRATIPDDACVWRSVWFSIGSYTGIRRNVDRRHSHLVYMSVW